MQDYQHFFEANRKLWNRRTPIHLGSDFYDVEAFRNGQSTLCRPELDALGDVSGKSLLHLQCHFGLDTLSWARMGAKVTGIDLSDTAIEAARNLAQQCGINARFECCNVYDTAQHVEDTFDIVFTSYGTIGWLPDLDPWAEVISKKLRKGGTFFIADFHPFVWMMDSNFTEIKYAYHNAGVISETSSSSYADRETEQEELPEYGWNHSFSEIFNALIRHGLQLVKMEEFPYSPYNCFNNLEQGTDGMWRIKNMNEKIPMMYTITAVKS